MQKIEDHAISIIHFIQSFLIYNAFVRFDIFIFPIGDYESSCPIFGSKVIGPFSPSATGRIRFRLCPSYFQPRSKIRRITLFGLNEYSSVLFVLDCTSRLT